MVQTNGTSVYKARSLYALIAPAYMFDDLKLCNSAGVYKVANITGNNTNGIFDAENNYLQGVKPDIEKVKSKSNNFFVYPNPAHTILNVKYNIKENEKARLIIYDIVGREKMRVYLSSNANNVSFTINMLTQGVYCYKYIVEGEVNAAGKLIID